MGAMNVNQITKIPGFISYRVVKRGKISVKLQAFGKKIRMAF